MNTPEKHGRKVGGAGAGAHSASSFWIDLAPGVLYNEWEFDPNPLKEFIMGDRATAGGAAGGGGISVVKPGGAYISLPGGGRIPITRPGGGFRVTPTSPGGGRGARPAGGGGAGGVVRGIGNAVRGVLGRIIGRRG
ncbi:MAG: hypothetical protein WC322_06575 [Candidatus Paceibacterota bacterium]